MVLPAQVGFRGGSQPAAAPGHEGAAPLGIGGDEPAVDRPHDVLVEGREASPRPLAPHKLPPLAAEPLGQRRREQGHGQERQTVGHQLPQGFFYLYFQETGCFSDIRKKRRAVLL